MNSHGFGFHPGTEHLFSATNAMIAAMHPPTRKALKISAIQSALRKVWDRIRYSQRHEGDLVVGDKAPDVVLTALDGISAVRLHERTGGRPTVLIFGSYT